MSMKYTELFGKTQTKSTANTPSIVTTNKQTVKKQSAPSGTMKYNDLFKSPLPKSVQTKPAKKISSSSSLLSTIKSANSKIKSSNPVYKAVKNNSDYIKALERQKTYGDPRRSVGKNGANSVFDVVENNKRIDKEIASIKEKQKNYAKKHAKKNSSSSDSSNNKDWEKMYGSMPYESLLHVKAVEQRKSSPDKAKVNWLDEKMRTQLSKKREQLLQNPYNANNLREIVNIGKELDDSKEKTESQLEDESKKATDVQGDTKPVKLTTGEKFIYYPAIFSNGALDAMENTWDFLVAGSDLLFEKITGIFGENKVSKMFKSDKEYHLNKETYGAKTNREMKEYYQRPEWVKNYVEPTLESAGAMLPTIAAAVATGGGSAAATGAKGVEAAAKANKAAMTGRKIETAIKAAKDFFNPSSTLFGTSAAGGNAKTAYSESKNADASLAYGAYSGYVEMVTERLFGGIAGTNIGDSIIKWGSKNKTVNKILSNVAVKRGLDTAGEGIEEVISAWADPYLKRATYDKNAPNTTMQEYGMAAIQGMLLSAFMGVATYPVRRYNVSQMAKAVNVAFDEVKEVMPNETVPKPLNSIIATESQVIKRQEQLKQVTQKYESKVSNYYDNVSLVINKIKSELEEYKNSIITKADIAVQTNGSKKKELMGTREFQLEYIG